MKDLQEPKRMESCKETMQLSTPSAAKWKEKMLYYYSAV